MTESGSDHWVLVVLVGTKTVRADFFSSFKVNAKQTRRMPLSHSVNEQEKKNTRMFPERHANKESKPANTNDLRSLLWKKCIIIF